MTRTILEMVPGALSEYYDWLKDAESGDVLVYWLGDLQYDRHVKWQDPDRLSEQSLLNVVASRIFADAKNGQVIPTQKRIGPYIFEYRITRCVRSTERSEPSRIRNDDLIPA